MRVPLRLLGLLVAGLFALGVGAQTAPASPGTLVVDDDGFATMADCDATTPADSPTISGAVAIASPGDTIVVCPGLYHEQVMINKDNLQLVGAQAGVPGMTRPSVPNPLTESIIDHECGPVQLMANNISLNGFMVQGSVLPDPCFLSGIWSNPGSSGTNGGFTIVNNIVQDNISGIELDSTCSAGTTFVQFNLIQNNNNPGAGSGNGIQTNFGLCHASINDNEFGGHTNASFLGVAPSSDVHVDNNTLDPGSSERIVFGAVTNGTISGNVSTGSTSSGTIRLFGGDSKITIFRNTLLNGMRGIRIDDVGFGINTDVVAQANCIQGNVIAGMEVEPGGYPVTPQLNAENNWWGSSSGPNEIPRNPTGTGDKIVDPEQNVDFTPWLTKPTGPPCPAAPPPPNTPGKVTGGGQIEGDPIFSPLGELLSLPAIIPSINGGSQASFGFTVKCCPATGNLDYKDHGANVRIKAESISGLNISAGSCGPNTHASFKGQAAVIRSIGTTHEDFTVDVDDCGEPGTSDTFRIETDTYNSGPPQMLLGGNIQIHK